VQPREALAKRQAALTVARALKLRAVVFMHPLMVALVGLMIRLLKWVGQYVILYLPATTVP